MSIMLGNLSVEEIESRLNVELSGEDKTVLKECKQEKAENIEAGKWHCFDIPFMIVCGDKQTAEKLTKLFTAYDLSHVRQSCAVTWEKHEAEEVE